MKVMKSSHKIFKISQLCALKVRTTTRQMKILQKMKWILKTYLILFRNFYSTESQSKDDIPLALLQHAKKRKCMWVKWVKHGLEETEPIVIACEQEILPISL